MNVSCGYYYLNSIGHQSGNIKCKNAGQLPPENSTQACRTGLVSDSIGVDGSTDNSTVKWRVA